MLLKLVLGFEPHVGRSLEYICKMKNQRNQLLRAPSRVGWHDSTRIDEGRKCWSLLAIQTEARTVVGEEESPLSDPGSEPRLGREKEKDNSMRVDKGRNRSLLAKERRCIP